MLRFLHVLLGVTICVAPAMASVSMAGGYLANEPPVPLVGYMSDADYTRLDYAPLKEFNYAVLGKFLAERAARGAKLSPVGDEIAYWAEKQRGTKLGLNIADFKGVTGQYMAMKSVALAYARNLDEYFAILSLIQFEQGRISWTYHNRDIGGQLIENNAWIWHNVTEEILANLGPEAEGRFWSILNPRFRQQRALNKGERPEFYRKAGNLDSVKESEPYVGKFVMGACSKAGYEFPEDMLKPGDILIGVGDQELTPGDRTLASAWTIDTDACRFALTHSVGVVIATSRGVEVATIYGDGMSSGSVRTFAAGGKNGVTAGAIVLRPTSDAGVVLAKAQKWLNGATVRPDWSWLDSAEGDARLQVDSRVYGRDAAGVATKRKSTLDYTLSELWFYLDPKRMESFLGAFGVAKKAD